MIHKTNTVKYLQMSKSSTFPELAMRSSVVFSTVTVDFPAIVAVETETELSAVERLPDEVTVDFGFVWVVEIIVDFVLDGAKELVVVLTVPDDCDWEFCGVDCVVMAKYLILGDETFVQNMLNSWTMVHLKIIIIWFVEDKKTRNF